MWITGLSCSGLLLHCRHMDRSYQECNSFYLSFHSTSSNLDDRNRVVYVQHGQRTKENGENILFTGNGLLILLEACLQCYDNEAL
ncbi:hypothetical protein ACB092_03G168100 [Castanea dentata]